MEDSKTNPYERVPHRRFPAMADFIFALILSVPSIAFSQLMNCERMFEPTSNLHSVVDDFFPAVPTLIKNLSNPQKQFQHFVESRPGHIQEVTHLFSSKAISRKEVPLHKITIKENNVEFNLEFASIRRIVPDLNSQTDIVIGIREGTYFQNGNLNGYAPHAYLIADGWRFDGGFTGAPSHDSQKSVGVEKGFAFVVRGLSRDDVASIRLAISKNLKVKDLSCYNALFQFLLNHSSLQLDGVHRNTILMPTEYIDVLLNDGLTTTNGHQLTVQPFIVGDVDFQATYAGMISWEIQEMQSKFQSHGYLVPHLIEDPFAFDYREVMGWRP